MPRKFYDNKPFAYKINLYDRDGYDELVRERQRQRMRLIYESDHWRRVSHERLKMFFCYQIIKMKRQIHRPWYCYYTVDDYGAPGEREFLCSRTSMRARTIKKEYAIFYRIYYAKCITVSKMILRWLCDLDPLEHTFELHQYLLRFLVVKRPSKYQADEYKKRRADKIARALQ